VDEDANIILGATFDSSLDGIIRVSVVATGIDKPAGIADMNDQRLAEAGERLRAQAAARQAEAANFSRPAAPAPASAPAPESYYAAPAPQPVQAAPAPAQAAPAYAAPAPAAPQPAYAPPAAPAPAAYAPPQQQAYAPHHGDVQIKQVRPQPHPYQEAPAAPVRRVEAPVQADFIPPAPEQPFRQTQMPRAEDFPVPGQNLLRARQGTEVQPASENRRRTLLERLATFGMSRAEEHPVAPAQQPPQLAAPQHYAQPAYQPRQANPSAVHAEYAKRPPAPGRNPGPAAPEPHGRPQSRAEDDQLEIPAFLRRQSN
jgi:cell division protein FtsZ